MRFFKRIFNFFLSLRAAIWLLSGLLCLLFYGSVVMPSDAAYETMNSVVLFDWIRQTSPAHTWWLIGSIVLLSLLTANTLVCSVESVIKKWDGRKWLLRLSPQVMHIGFLFILLAHLLSSAQGMRAMTRAFEGSVFGLPEGEAFRITELKIDIGPAGYVSDWRAGVEYLRGDTVVKKDYLAPNKPSFFRGFGIYLKDVQPFPAKSALLEVTREPGAPWALAGGIFFTLGTVLLVALKMKRET